MDRGQITEQYNQDSQANCRFGSSHSQNKEHEHLPVQILQEMREGDKVGVHCQQHQFDSHQKNDQVLPVQEKTDHADAEQNSGQDEEM